VKRAIVEELDVLLQPENGLLGRAQAMREIHLLNSRGGGKVQGIAQQRERWHGARSYEIWRDALARSQVIPGWKVKPGRKAQVV